MIMMMEYGEWRIVVLKQYHGDVDDVDDDVGSNMCKLHVENSRPPTKQILTNNRTTGPDSATGVLHQLPQQQLQKSHLLQGTPSFLRREHFRGMVDDNHKLSIAEDANYYDNL